VSASGPLGSAAGRERVRASLYARARSAVDRRGPMRALGLGVRRLITPMVDTGTLIFFARDLTTELPAKPPPPGYQAREATPAELEAIGAGSDPGRSLESLRERFRRGHLCIVVVDDRGRFVHTRWLTAEAAYIPESGRNLLLAPGDAYFYDGYTHRDARGRGLDGVVRCAIFHLLAGRGYRRAISYVRSDNPVGLRAARRWQTAIGRVRYVRIGRKALAPIGVERIAPLAFAEGLASDGDEEEHARRIVGWRQWFESWLEQPVDRRSTGFSSLPDAYFNATAAFVADALELDPARDSLLDVGCSSAGVTRRLAARARRLTGADSVSGLLADAARLGIADATGRPARFVTTDGRRLPFADGAFDKVSCMSMIHVLASHDDAERVVRELIRVTAPGGTVLIGGLPDRARRGRARLEYWRRGGWREKLEVLGALLLPTALRARLRRLFRIQPRHRLVALQFDLERVSARLGALAPHCRKLTFPPDFWSRDFRETRSNLVISLPESLPLSRPVGFTDSPSRRASAAVPHRFEDRRAEVSR
jgi:SAM-dependent methyltransferase